MNMTPIAYITADVAQALGLPCEANTPIFLGASNIAHMKRKHPQACEKYYSRISEILSQPEYVGLNPTDNSIEYVREYRTEEEEFVKVAVRISLSGRYYARSIYILGTNRAKNFIQKGTLKPLQKLTP